MNAAGFAHHLTGLAPSFKSVSLNWRNERIDETKKHSKQIHRELERDRAYLEKREKQLLNEVKRLASKGDIYAARLVAKQIAHYRRLQHKNLQNDIKIETKVQMVSSANKLHKAEIETIKGLKHCNMGETVGMAENRHIKYARRLEEFDSIEELMNCGMDDIYDDSSSEDEEGAKSNVNDNELQAIIGEAINPSKYGRYYFDHRGIPQLKCNKAILHFRLYNEHSAEVTGASMYVDTLDLSVDMLKRLLVKDTYMMAQLGIFQSSHNMDFGNIRQFQIGRLCKEKSFSPFIFSKSLKECKVSSGDTLWIQTIP